MKIDIAKKRILGKSFDEKPIVSIITVVHNGINSLEKTILSVINQSYNNIEYIIIDGGSTDGTIDIINKYNDKIDFWISEPDKGIYDAMNKGINFATGEWINFMNCTDEFYSESTITSVFEKKLQLNASIIYGDTIAFDENSNTCITIKGENIKKIWKSMVFSHQACFIKSNLCKKYSFNLEFNLAADYYMILRFYYEGLTFLYIPIAIDRRRIPGISYSNPNTIIEIRKAFLQLNNNPFGNIYHSWKVLSVIFNYWIRNLLGIKLTSKIRGLKWKVKYMFSYLL